MLRNRFYIGEVKYNGEIFPGEQPPILDRKLLDAVQVKLERQRTNHTAARHASESILMGLIYDERGNRMTPTYALKKGVRYRYYVSSNLHQGDKANAAALNRVPAVDIEALVVAAVKKQLGTTSSKAWKETASAPDGGVPSASDGELIRNHVVRVDSYEKAALMHPK